MRENKRRTLMLIIITISVLVLMVMGATYAYFSTTKDLEDGVVGTNVTTAATTYSFTAKTNETLSGGKIELDISSSDMSEANVSSTKIKSDIAGIDVSLVSPRKGINTVCTYDIVWVWDSTDQYIKADVDEFPYCEGEMRQSYGPNGPYMTCYGNEYNYEFTAKVDDKSEQELSELTNNNKIVLARGEIIKSNSTIPVSKTHIIETSIYNLPIEQKNLFGKNFQAHLTVENIECNMENANLAYHQICDDDSAACTIAKLYTDDGINNLYYHDGFGLYQNANLEAEDNSYRYSGENPNNYACFLGDDCNDDNNLYRIIGVIDGKVKLIKYTDVNLDREVVWNDNNRSYITLSSNIWENSNMEKYLNSLEANYGYYCGMDEMGIKEQTCYKEGYLHTLGNKIDLIEPIIWNTERYVYSNNNVKKIYELEFAGNSKTSQSKRIGLMYVSEYMYASEPIFWNNFARSYSLSKGKNWMLSSADSWTITGVNEYPGSSAIYISSDGNIYDDNVYNKRNAVQPTFNLSSNATITNIDVEGVGSKTKPMLIS